jgi:oligopeptide transport system substrate-binding protein
MLLAACQAQPGVNVVTGTPDIRPVVVTATPAPAAKPQRPNIIRTILSATDMHTLDPSLPEDTAKVAVVEEAFVGLTRLDETTSELHPGMATRWDISPDGKVYTFYIRQDVPWVKWNGRQVVKVQTCPDKDGKTRDRLVTARDFEYGILRTLEPDPASPYAYVLGFVVQGADELASGAITDTSKVGVQALDDWTLQVKFKQSAAYNANIIGLWTAAAVPKWIIEGDDCTRARGVRWTELGFFQSYGPFTLKEWIHESRLTIVKNPFWPGDQATPIAKVDEVIFDMAGETTALAEFESGNLDVAGVPLADMDRIKADPKLSRLLHIAPSLGTYYYGFNTKARFVDDVRVRRALSLAVDRKSLVENVAKAGQEPAQWFSRPGLAGAPSLETHPNLGVKYDPEQARQLLADYLAEKRLAASELDITLVFNTSSGHQQIAEAIQQMWKDNLGLNVKLADQEWKYYLQAIQSRNAPQIWRSGWYLDYPDANNFVREVFAVGGNSNPANKGEPKGGVNWKNGKFEELVKQAAVEMNLAKRVELYAQAEQILVYDDAVIIPLYWYTMPTMTQPWVKRTFSVGGRERYEKWQVMQDQ